MRALVEKNETDLRKLLAEKREALRVFRFAVAGGKTKNVKEGKTLRREIARVLTVLSAKGVRS